jgi:hypothetical protein
MAKSLHFIDRPCEGKPPRYVVSWLVVQACLFLSNYGSINTQEGVLPSQSF